MKRALIAIASASAAAVAAGLAYQFIGVRRDRGRFPAPGKLHGGIHLHASGSGSPAVILESGIAATSLSWQLVQPEVARFTRVASYDRAGLGWSPSPKPKSREPLSLMAVVQALRITLDSAAIRPPYVLVGHSFGGLAVRFFAANFPEEVAALVLIDPVLPSEWIDMPPESKSRLALGTKLSRRGATLAWLGVVRLSLSLLTAGARRLPQWIARASGRESTGVVARLIGEVRKLPPKLWPAVQAHWSDPKNFNGMAAHLEALPQAALEVQKAPLPPEIRVWILSAGNATEAQRREWDRLAPNGRHIPVPESGHWIQFDNPQAVIETIREAVDFVRKAHTSLELPPSSFIQPREGRFPR